MSTTAEDGRPTGTAGMTKWKELTDEDRQRAFESLPNMLEGFLKTWGWLHFAKAIEEICRKKNAATHAEDSKR